MELAGGNSKVNESLIYKIPYGRNDDYMKDMDILLEKLNKEYSVTIGSVMYPIDRNAPISDAPSICPVMLNSNDSWRPNIINGRYLTKEESLSNKKIAVIGNTIYKTLFKDRKFSQDMKINIYETEYEVVGVIGRTKRYSPQNAQIVIPYENYFSLNKEDADPSNILINISGAEPLDTSSIDENLDKVNKPVYINDIKIPLKLILVVGILLLVVTILNEGNMFTLWIINRKKEISIKKALGATNLIIIISTVVESIIISLISSIISLAIQYFIDIKLNSILMDYELRITWLNYIVAISISIVIAIISSLIPSKLILSIDPVEELRT